MASTATTNRYPRVDPSRADAVAPRQRRFLSPALACYVGLTLIVLVSIALRRVLPDGLAVVIFLVASATLVLVLHPRITLRR